MLNKKTYILSTEFALSSQLVNPGDSVTHRL